MRLHVTVAHAVRLVGFPKLGRQFFPMISWQPLGPLQKVKLLVAYM